MTNKFMAGVLVALFALSLISGIAVAQSTTKPFSKDDVIRLLTNYVSPSRVAELAREHGISFAVTPDSERELRRAGADGSLLRVLRGLAPKSANRALDESATPKGADTNRSTGGPPLDQVQILGLIISSESSPYLAKLVRERSVNFRPSDQYITELRDAGGEKVLENALRLVKPVPRVASATANSVEAEVVQHIYQGSQSEKKGQLPEAEKEYRVALALADRNPVLHIDLGHVLLMQGKIDDAQAEFQTSVKLWPNSPIAHCDLGYTYFLKHSLDQAISEQRQAIRLQPSYADAHGHLAGDLRSKGDWEEAAAEYRKAIDVQPDLNSWRLDFADALFANGDGEGAKALWKDATRVQPDDPLLHNRIGVSLEGRNDWQSAVSELREAARLKPEDPQFHVNLGWALLNNGDKDNALAEYRIATTLKPDDALLHNQIGFALKNKGTRNRR